MVFTLDSGSESPGVTPDQEICWLNSWHVGFCVERCRLKTRLSHCVVFLDSALTVRLSTQEYIWVPGFCKGSLVVLEGEKGK